MDVHAKLAEIRRVVEQARSMPMSASAVVNRTEVLGLLDELKAELNDAFSHSDKIARERDDILEEGRREAALIVEDARNERDRLVSDTELFRVAQRQADQVVADAHSEAEEMRKETDDYVDSRLANVEISLERTMDAVKRGRERLAGRSAFDDLTADEADKITLPEHLDR